MSPRPLAPMPAAALALLGVAGCRADAPAVGEGRIETADGPLAWLRVGEGPSLVVVHGGPGLDHRYLRPGIDALAGGRSVVYWDQRGVGRSVPDGPLDTLALSWDATLEDLDRVVARFADADGRVALLAHSWGTLPALAWAASRPRRLRALVLVAPADPTSRFSGETARRREARVRPGARARLDSLLEAPPERRREARFRSELLRAAFRATAADPDVVDALDLDLLPTTAANADVVARRVAGTAPAPDPWAQAARIRAPVLVVQGGADLAPPALARELADAFPAGRALVLDGAGHFPFAGEPAARFHAVVDSFLVRSGSR